MAEKIKVFVSWSGERAKEYAKVVRAWLDGFDNAAPFISDADVQTGQLGIPKILNQLQSCAAGIVIVTQESAASQWVNFEAGYLACMVEDAERRVMPLLMDGIRPANLTGPLSFFQAVETTEEGLKKLTKSLCQVLEIDTDRVNNKVEAMWPLLRNALVDVALPAESSPQQKRATPEMIEEILTIVRGLRQQNPVYMSPDPGRDHSPWAIKLLKQVQTDLARHWGEAQASRVRIDGFGQKGLSIVVPGEMLEEAAELAELVSMEHGVPIIVQSRAEAELDLRAYSASASATHTSRRPISPDVRDEPPLR